MKYGFVTYSLLCIMTSAMLREKYPSHRSFKARFPPDVSEMINNDSNLWLRTSLMVIKTRPSEGTHYFKRCLKMEFRTFKKLLLPTAPRPQKPWHPKLPSPSSH